MAGGDSAGRGLVAGMILGAHLGLEAIPPRWLSELKAYDRIVELMDRIDENAGASCVCRPGMENE
jgi:ADP-ribosylglycohydrolase